jgi:hypothetical protein
MNVCDLADFGGSANGDLPSSPASIGEYTVVASAKRGVRGALRDCSEELDEVRSRAKGSDRFFSSSTDEAVSCLYGQLVRSRD